MMTWLAILGACVVGLGDDPRPGPDLAADPFLRPYVEQVRADLKAEDLRSITAMSRDDLIQLHLGLGMTIRNRWLRGNREPALIQFFRDRRINDPDEMSMVVITALWRDLNTRLDPAERTAIMAHRALVARKRAAYEVLEAEGQKQLARGREEFDRAYAALGLPSPNPANRDPFYRLVVARTGRVQQVVFCDGASPQLQARLTEILKEFRFTPFGDDEVATLTITEFPYCRVAERNTLNRR